MKIYVAGRREIAIVILCVAVAAAMLLLVPKGIRAVSAAAVERKLPIYCVQTDKKEIALTFDAAWGNSDTDKLLSVLEKGNAKATFFFTGQWVSKYPDDVRKIFAGGHTCANHTDKHRHIKSLSPQELKADTEECNKKIEALTGTAPTLFRGPYGEYNNTLIDVTDSLSMQMVQWDVDSRDWQKKKTPSQIAEDVCKNVKNGSIVLFHNDVEGTPEAVQKVITCLAADGYSFVTADELIYKDNFWIDSAGCQHENSADR